MPTAQLPASPDGLAPDEVARRLARFAYNELPEKEANPLLKFLAYFWGLIPWMIEAAALLSALVQHWQDFSIILHIKLAAYRIFHPEQPALFAPKVAGRPVVLQ